MRITHCLDRQLIGGLILLLAATAEAGLEPPDAVGPWAVGRSTFTLVDPARDDRTFDVDVWYPVDAGDTAGAATAEYSLVFASLPSPMALDAPPVSAQGVRPLIVFSHGSGGIRYQSYFLTEFLASHGFIVAAPDHAGNTAIDTLLGTEAPFEEVALDRPRDVSAVISVMLDRSADPQDNFSGRIDAARIGVSGHSFGGFTAFAIAGADPDNTPVDNRVRAILPLAPATSSFTDPGFSAVDIPLFMLSATLDATTPVDPNTNRPWKGVSSLYRYRGDIIDAGHQSFTNICDIVIALQDAGVDPGLIGDVVGQAEEGCGPDLIDIDEAHRLTRIYALSFMKVFVAGDLGFRHYLSPRYGKEEGHAVDYSVFGTPVRPPVR